MCHRNDQWSQWLHVVHSHTHIASGFMCSIGMTEWSQFIHMATYHVATYHWNRSFLLNEASGHTMWPHTIGMILIEWIHSSGVASFIEWNQWYGNSYVHMSLASLIHSYVHMCGFIQSFQLPHDWLHWVIPITTYHLLHSFIPMNASGFIVAHRNDPYEWQASGMWP